MTNVKRITSQELTTADLPSQMTTKLRSDLLFRVVTTATDSGPDAWDIRYANTHEVTNPIRQFMQSKVEEVDLLARVVNWQHGLLDYNSHYIAHLLEQTSEEEFEQIAEQFAYEPANIPPAVLAPLVQQIYQLTNIPYTPSDIADLFHCDHANAFDAIQRIAADNPIVHRMLPNLIEATDVE